MSKHLLIFVAILFAKSTLLHAQEPTESDTLEIKRDRHQKVTFARFKGKDETAARKSPDDLKVLESLLQIRQQVDQFRKIKETTDDLGYTHRKYQQYYRGVKVDNAQFITHSRSSVEVVNGSFSDVGNLSVSPALSEAQALQLALQSVKATKYAWEDADLEAWLKSSSNDPAASFYPTGELVVASVTLNEVDTVRLAWKFSITAKDPDISAFVYVDAGNGSILKRLSRDCTTNAPGTVQSQYSGTQNITGDSFTNGFRLRELRNNVQINTLNINHQLNPTLFADFVDNDNNWTTAEHPNDRGALDAHWGSEAVLDYFRTVHNRNSLNGTGMTINNYIHWGTNIANAAWRAAYNAMFYGDGGVSGFSFFNSMTSLDITSHEMGHGINQFEATLAYEKESGALNEGMSDIWGAVVEAWRAPAKQRWQIGEDVGGPLRRMDNPNLSLVPQPDTYLGANYVNTNCTPSIQNDFCGVHTNSGVLNFWFFLLSQGGTGTNDIGNAFNVTGIGIVNAAAIAYRMETNYLTSNATFATARDAAIQSARDLFGTNSCLEIAVTNAWFAVGVGTAFNPNTISISGTQYACTSATYTGLGPNPAWSIISATGVANLTTSGRNATLTKVSDGTVTLRAVFSGCGINTTTIDRTIRVGFPSQVGSVTGPTPVYAGALYHYYLISPVPTNGITWTVPSGWSIFAGQGSTRATIQTGNSPGYVKATVTACGSTSARQFYSTIGSGGPNPLRKRQDTLSAQRSNPDSSNIIADNNSGNNILIYPNPSSGQVIIQMSEKDLLKKVAVYNTNGALIRRLNYGAGVTRATIDMSDALPGTYLIELDNGNNTPITKKIIIQR